MKVENNIIKTKAKKDLKNNYAPIVRSLKDLERKIATTNSKLEKFLNDNDIEIIKKDLEKMIAKSEYFIFSELEKIFSDNKNPEIIKEGIYGNIVIPPYIVKEGNYFSFFDSENEALKTLNNKSIHKQHFGLLITIQIFIGIVLLGYAYFLN